MCPYMGRVFVFRWFSSNPTPPSSQRRKHHQRAQIGTLVVSASSPPLPPARDENATLNGTRFHLWLHSFHQTPLTCPFGHVSGVQQVLQPDTLFVSAYIRSPPEHYQHAHLGILVFHYPHIPPLIPHSSCFI